MSSSGPGTVSNRFRRPIFLAISAIVAVSTILAARDVMLPFVLALLIAYVLTPVVAWLERHRVRRVAGILLVYVFVLGLVALFVATTARRVGEEIRNLRRDVPALADRARQQWLPRLEAKIKDLGLAPPPSIVEPPDPRPAFVLRSEPDGATGVEVKGGLAIHETKTGYRIGREPEVEEEPSEVTRMISDVVGHSVAYARRNLTDLMRIGRDLVMGFSRGIFKFFITLMLAAYLILTREKVLRFFESLVRPSARADFMLLVGRVDRGLSGVVRGQIVICLVNGVLSAIGFAAAGLKYWPVLALVAAVFSLIPIFGSFASSIPAVAIGITQSPKMAMFVLCWIVGIHQLEANFLNPKIMGDAAKIHPVLVVFALLMGEHFFHTVGALLAVPVMSIAQSVFLHFREVVQRGDAEWSGSVDAGVDLPITIEESTLPGLHPSDL